MTFQNLYYFIEAAKDLNFSKTAERLFVSQQSISKHIGKLEEHYGARLFERKPNLQLTAPGRSIAARAAQIFSIECELREELSLLQAKKQISILVKCNLTKANVFFPEVLKHYADRYPEVQVLCEGSKTLELGDTRIQTDLLSHAVHFYIGEQIPVTSKDIIAIPLLRDRNILALSKQRYAVSFPDRTDLLLRAETGASPGDFGDVPFLLQEDMDVPSTHAYFLNKVGGLRKETCLSFRHIPLDVMISMCQQDMGAILLSHLLLYHYLLMGAHSIHDLYFFNVSIKGVPHYRDLYLYHSRDITDLHPALHDFPAVVQAIFHTIEERIAREIRLEGGCIAERGPDAQTVTLTGESRFREE